MATRSSPNGLGLYAGFLDYLLIVYGLNFWAISNSPKIEIPRLFSDSPELNFLGLFSNNPELNCETEFRIVHAYSSVCIAKMNNMIVV